MDERIISVQKMQDYIESNYEEKITMSALSKVSGFSPWFAYRLFKHYTGLTPSQYARKIKLSKSVLMLKQEGCKVIEAAYNSGFESVDGYQRAFYREFGCNPGSFSEKPVPVCMFIPYGVKFRELRKESKKMKDIQNIFIQIIQKPERKVIIKRGEKAEGYFSYCEEVGCDIWGILTSMNSLCGEPVCMWLPDKYIKPGTSRYVQGVEAAVDYNGDIPQGFDVITLPPAKYLMFQTEPFKEEDYCEVIVGLQSAIKKYDPSVIGYEWDDSNPSIQLEPKGSRGYIELKAVKQK